MDLNNGIINKNDKFNQFKSINKFENLKSNYILQKIFNDLQRKKYLEIIKYNKQIQKRLDINIKDYKEYSEVYSSIEIDIIPGNLLGKFIKFKEKDKKYYHIYFNNNTKESQKNYFGKNIEIEVKKIKIIIDYQIKSFRDLFYRCECIESISFEKFYRNNIDNMASMFAECSSLKEINLSNFNTCNVINMSGMFCGCSKLEKINLTKFSTNKVKDMSFMFCRCYSLKEINVTNFNTNNVTNIKYMFNECSNLKEINFSNFNTNNVTEMGGMFNQCFSLKEIDLSNFETKKVTYMNHMFNECTSLKEVNISNFDFSNIIDMHAMFSGCSKEIKEKVRAQIKDKNIREGFVEEMFLYF